MKTRLLHILIFTWVFGKISAQSKNFIDMPYIETSAKADTLVMPDKIYLSIVLTEGDTKNKKSTEHLEKELVITLERLKINTEKDLTVADMGSDFRKFFLKSQAIIKAKSYQLLVRDASTAGKVLVELEKVGISNISIAKTEYSKADQLILELKEKAIKKAKLTAQTLVKPLSQQVGKAIFISCRDTTSGKHPQDALGIRIRGAAKIEDWEDYESLINFKKLHFEVFTEAKFKLE